jgi:hypothetical protein
MLRVEESAMWDKGQRCWLGSTRLRTKQWEECNLINLWPLKAYCVIMQPMSFSYHAASYSSALFMKAVGSFKTWGHSYQTLEDSIIVIVMRFWYLTLACVVHVHAHMHRHAHTQTKLHWNVIGSFCVLYLACSYMCMHACAHTQEHTYINSKSCGRKSEKTAIVFDCFDLSKGANALFIHSVLNN